jgi:DHA1 family multidrug resistance protein-like MFS transporter
VYTVIVGRFTADTGYFMVLPFLTVYVSQLDMSGLEAGALFAILQAMRLGLGVPAGWASDRFGSSVVLVAGLLLEAAGYVQFLLAGASFPAWAAA